MVSSQDSALLAAFMEAAVDAIVVSDSAGKILRVNPAASNMFDLSERDLLGQSVNILMPKAFAERHDEFMRDYLETGEKRVIGIGRNVEGRKKDGSHFPLHLSVGRAAVDGAVIFVGIMHDLSVRHATQAALERSQRLDAIGQMTGGIAHDFNNLLTVVIGNLELLEMRISDKSQLDFLSDALEAAELGSELTSSLMAFSRKSDLQPELMDVNEICTSTLSLLSRTMGPGFITTTYFSEDLHHILADPSQLQSALVNLCLNAKDAMGSGGTLTLSTENIVIDDKYIAQEVDVIHGEYVRLSVSDTGCGMSSETQARAFEPFYTTKRSQHGTGLGLAMVYGFVKQSGGHITIYSEIDQGTTISLYFPAVAPGEVVPIRPAASEEPKPGNGQLVLIVEDSPQVRRLSVERVRDLGYRTIQAETGDEGYEILKSRDDISVLFTDVIMPGHLNGFELAEKARVEFPDLKILITSGYAEDVLFHGSSGVSEVDILRKPYRQHELAIRLHVLTEAD